MCIRDRGKVFYQPSDQGYEAAIRVDVARRREAQLAAMLDADEARGEILTHSPDDAARERWLQRTISGAGARLGQVRDRVLDAARLSNYSIVLDLKAGAGLLTWEAVRRTPEGGVYALTRNRRDADALRQSAERLPQIERPVVMEGRLEELPLFLSLQTKSTLQIKEEALAANPRPSPLAPSSRLRFDAIVGYNALLDEADKAAACQELASLLAPGGVISLAERVPRRTQRLLSLIHISIIPTRRSASMRSPRSRRPRLSNRPPSLTSTHGARGLTAAPGFTRRPARLIFSTATSNRSPTRLPRRSRALSITTIRSSRPMVSTCLLYTSRCV